jgi:hypothetical protein
VLWIFKLEAAWIDGSKEGRTWANLLTDSEHRARRILLAECLADHRQVIWIACHGRENGLPEVEAEV